MFARCVRAAVAFALLCGLAPASRAEYCSMIGCRGDIGYVFLPASGRHYTAYKFNDQSCALPEDYDPFGGERLPDVNAKVSIQTITSFFDETELARDVDKFQPLGVENFVRGKPCRVSWAQPDGGMQINSSTKVRILGYRTFIGHYRVVGKVRTVVYDRQLLFALVQVIED